MIVKLMFLTIAVHTVLCQHESAKRCARAANTCFLAAEATEGPYYWNSTGRPGFPLRLSITVVDTRTCLPIPNAVVDLWHCDSLGIYSHFIAASQGQIGAATDNSTFFRGQQLTNYQGVAIFNTIYPGWYRGRATHMHVKVHIDTSLTSINGIIYVKSGHVSHTGQFFFDDSLTDVIGRTQPYSSNTVQRTRNNEDMIYSESNGSTMIIPIQFLTSMFSDGMTGEITVGVDPSATPAAVGGGGIGPRPPGPPPTGL